MTEQEEKQAWQRMLQDLQELMTVAQIAEEVGVEDREVWRWKAGERRPRGIIAIKVYVLHVKRCPDRQWLFGHVHTRNSGIAS